MVDRKPNFNPLTGALDDSGNYMQMFTSYSGADIRAVLGGVEIGEIQQISVSVSREKGGNFVLGDENARSFSRGRRFIGGSLMFGFFSKEALLEGMRNAQACAPGIWAGEFYQWSDGGPNMTSRGGESVSLNPDGLVTMDPRRQDTAGAASDLLLRAAKYGPRKLQDIRYADQILPFNITITAANEYGQHCRMALLGVEIMNAETGFAVETMQADHRYTFMAREVAPWVKGISTNGGSARNGQSILDRVAGNAVAAASQTSQDILGNSVSRTMNDLFG
jgi:hypothetical protein